MNTRVMNMLVEIHVLQNHAPSNLNRDDSGSPKDCLFGGYQRARISSQCIKRSARQSAIFKEGMKDIGMGIRTRLLPKLVKDAMLNKGFPEDVASIAASVTSMIGKKRAKPKKGKKNQESDETDESNGFDTKPTDMQIMFFSKGEIDMVVSTIVDAYKECKTVDEAKKVDPNEILDKIEGNDDLPVTPDIALFGRMITSDAFRNIEASMQVAHAISTNAIEHEFDYFTAVDDLQNDKDDKSMKDHGAGMVGDIEFTSACYYKYFNLDVDAFIENMNIPDKVEASSVLSKTVASFLRAVFLVSPSGKQNTFAAHQLPDAILVEIRPDKIPVSYANAFLKPAKPHAGMDLVDDSIAKLADHASIIWKKYRIPVNERFWFSTRDIAIDGSAAVDTVNDLIDFVVKAIAGA